MFNKPLLGLMYSTRRLINTLVILFSILASAPAYAQEAVEVFVADFHDEELRLLLEENASYLLTTVNKSYEEKATSLDLKDGVISEKFAGPLNELWESTPFYVPETRIIETISKLSSGRYELRNVPAYFVDPDGEEHYEEAVIQFTPSGMISEFRIGLAVHRYQKIMGDGTDEIDNANREKILSFIENFRTSYNRKDIDFINNVFSDQALIIVGRVIENTGESSAFEKQVEYLQFTKGEYIERLERLFEVNEWINVGFEDIGIIRHPKFPDIYGVSITQFYNSSIYSDEGYLFLLIDFKDPEKPMIHVRTWQPKQITPEEEIFTIGHMEIF